MKSIVLSRNVASLCLLLVLLLGIGSTVKATPVLLSPSDGSTYSASSQAFEWESGATTVDAYALTIGSTDGADDIHDSGVLPANTLNHTVTSLGSAATLYVRLWSRNADGLWQYSSSEIVNAEAVLPPSIYSPTQNSQFASDSVTLNWRNNGTDVSQYWLYVGSSSGARDYFNQSVNSATSYTITNLPSDGSRVWVRLWYYVDRWNFQDHQFLATGDAAGQQNRLPEMTSPVEESLLTRSQVTFEWQNNNFIPNNYWIHIGTTIGSSNIHSSGALETANEYTYNNLPMGEDTIHVRLWYNDGSWNYTDYKYSSKLYGEAHLVWPIPGTTLEDDSQTFEWSANGQSFDNYQLLIGSSQGSNEFYDSGVLNASEHSTEAVNLEQNIEFVYATLRYRKSGNWKNAYYRYRTASFIHGFNETFDADISRWTESKGTWHNGDLQRLSTSVGNDYSLASYIGAVFTDLDFSAKVRRSDNEDYPTFLSIRDSGEQTGDYCWCANDGCYTFEISPAQNYAVWSCQGTVWVKIKSLEHSDLINPGNEWNEMRVVAEGSALSFYINNSLAWQGNDDTHVSGSVGIGLVNYTDTKPNALDIEWARLSVPSASRNLALSGKATQSSTSFGGLAIRANDGNTNGVHNNESVSHTEYQSQPWWQVDLGDKFSLEKVRLHNRTDCCDTRLSNVNIFVSDSDMSSSTFSELQADGDVYHYLVADALDSVTELRTANARGRYVRVQLSETNYLSLAEVEVIGR